VWIMESYQNNSVKTVYKKELHEKFMIFFTYLWMGGYIISTKEWFIKKLMKKLAEKRPKIKIIFSCLSSRREINRLCWIFWKRLLWNLCNDKKRHVEIMRKSWSFPKQLNLWVPNYFCHCSHHDGKERCYESLLLPFLSKL
jgi:hypothetical protein